MYITGIDLERQLVLSGSQAPAAASADGQLPGEPQPACFLLCSLACQSCSPLLLP